jgi:GNAT superfamily N-acetyltransferase
MITAEKKGIPDRVRDRALRLAKSVIIPGAADRNEVEALLKIIFPGEDLSDRRFLTWFYDDNPRGRAREFVAKCGETVTGHVAGVPMAWKIGLEKMTGGLTVNAVTRPDFRGKGIYILLVEELCRACLDDGFKIMYGFANLNSYRGGAEHLGYRPLANIPLWIKPLDLPGIVGGRKLSPPLFWAAAARAANPVARAARALVRPPKTPRAPEIETIAEFGPDFDAFWDEARSDYANILVRDRDFLNWRFVRQPTRRYMLLAARSGPRLLGYLVGTLASFEGLRWGLVVDLLVRNSAEGRSAAAHLVSAFDRRVEERGAAIGGGLMFKHAPAASGLRRNGYVRLPHRFLPREFPAMFRWNWPGPLPVGFYDPRRWFLTLGDYDAV